MAMRNDLLALAILDFLRAAVFRWSAPDLAHLSMDWYALEMRTCVRQGRGDRAHSEPGGRDGKTGAGKGEAR